MTKTLTLTRLRRKALYEALFKLDSTTELLEGRYFRIIANSWAYHFPVFEVILLTLLLYHWFAGLHKNPFKSSFSKQIGLV